VRTVPAALVVLLLALAGACAPSPGATGLGAATAPGPAIASPGASAMAPSASGAASPGVILDEDDANLPPEIAAALEALEHLDGPVHSYRMRVTATGHDAGTGFIDGAGSFVFTSTVVLGEQPAGTFTATITDGVGTVRVVRTVMPGDGFIYVDDGGGSFAKADISFEAGEREAPFEESVSVEHFVASLFAPVLGRFAPATRGTWAGVPATRWDAAPDSLVEALASLSGSLASLDRLSVWVADGGWLAGGELSGTGVTGKPVSVRMEVTDIDNPNNRVAAPSPGS
jgi:hypothetical protein